MSNLNRVDVLMRVECIANTDTGVICLDKCYGLKWNDYIAETGEFQIEEFIEDVLKDTRYDDVVKIVASYYVGSEHMESVIYKA